MLKNSIDTRSPKVRGVVCIIASAFCFAWMSTVLRLSGDLPTAQKAFFRNFVALIFALIILKKEKISLKPHDKKNLPALFARAICGTIGILGNFYAVDRLVLSDASMLNKMSPFFAVLFSYLILKEKLSLFQACTVAAAFIGSLFVIKPTAGVFSSFPAIAGLIGGLGAGAAYAAVRYAGSHGEKGPYIVAFFSGFSTLCFTPFLLLDYHPMTLKQLLLLIGAGLAAAGGQFTITAAYTYAPAKEISVYDYTQLIFTTIIGFCIFGDVPDSFSFIGYTIIVGAAIAAFEHNRKKP